MLAWDTVVIGRVLLCIFIHTANDMADEDTLDISYQLESIEVAVECIRGDLKQLAFGKFLRRASELLVSLANSVADGIWISTAGSFLKSVYEKASEAERVKFAELIQDHLCVVSHLVEVTCLILKGGKYLHVDI